MRSRAAGSRGEESRRGVPHPPKRLVSIVAARDGDRLLGDLLLLLELAEQVVRTRAGEQERRVLGLGARRSLEEQIGVLEEELRARTYAHPAGGPAARSAGLRPASAFPCPAGASEPAPPAM